MAEDDSVHLDRALLAKIEAAVAQRNRASADLLEAIMRDETTLQAASADELLSGHSVVINRPDGVVSARVIGSGEATVVRMDWRSTTGAGGHSSLPFALVAPAERRAKLSFGLGVQLLNVLEAAERDRTRPT